jgi:hypothetical protein
LIASSCCINSRGKFSCASGERAAALADEGFDLVEGCWFCAQSEAAKLITQTAANVHWRRREWVASFMDEHSAYGEDYVAEKILSVMLSIRSVCMKHQAHRMYTTVRKFLEAVP